MLIIGIAGGTGGGKTTVVNTIVDELKHDEVAVISQDSYYRDTSELSYEERTQINFDHPQSIDFDLLVIQNLYDFFVFLNRYIVCRNKTFKLIFIDCCCP